MTDTRKLYEAGWPHGYETRDGRKVTRRDVAFTSGLYWELPDGNLFMTNRAGCVTCLREDDLDIFCTPAPVVERVERWAPVSHKGSVIDVNKSCDVAASYVLSGSATHVVHLREVRPGDMTAEAVEMLAQKFDWAAKHSWGDSNKARWREAAFLLRAASRGEA